MNKYRILVKGIVKDGNEYLITKKWVDDNIIDPYQWQFMDGEVEFGESPDSAVIRIIQEQTGLSCRIDRILYTWSFMIGSDCNLGIAYLCSSDIEKDAVVLSEDYMEFRWVKTWDFDSFITNKKMLSDIANSNID